MLSVCQAFHVFKIFVANPNKGREVHELLLRNKVSLGGIGDVLGRAAPDVEEPNKASPKLDSGSLGTSCS